MWYFDFEHDMFEPDGKRKKAAPTCNTADPTSLDGDFLTTHAQGGDYDVLSRKKFHAREMGTITNPREGKQGLVMVKPYIETGEYPLDKERVFGRYISSGRPFEKIDLQISRLAM